VTEFADNDDDAAVARRLLLGPSMTVDMGQLDRDLWVQLLASRIGDGVEASDFEAFQKMLAVSCDLVIKTH
jgi:hypothetical protein